MLFSKNQNYSSCQYSGIFLCGRWIRHFEERVFSSIFVKPASCYFTHEILKLMHLILYLNFYVSIVVKVLSWIQLFFQANQRMFYTNNIIYFCLKELVSQFIYLEVAIVSTCFFLLWKIYAACLLNVLEWNENVFEWKCACHNCCHILTSSRYSFAIMLCSE